MSCFINLTTALAKNLESNLSSCSGLINSAMIEDSYKEYKKLLVDDFSLQPIKEVYDDFENGEEIWF